ncbi:MAG TPA: hypothetical protein EYQ24_13020 [Bacteroidetes bacterium]|nr:hypothetical protein [Bacteroidota bacterium]HIL57688.1 hypothetical protein [Rhodothermales bacterium]
MKLVFLAHLLATLTMFGVIWVIQLVHYPLFSGVGSAGWADYSAAHQWRITLIVGPAMVLELATAVWLVLDRPPAFPAWAVVAGLVAIGGIWASTALLSVPAHNALSGGWDAEAHARLVSTNWIRTALWSARTGLVLWLAALALDRGL